MREADQKTTPITILRIAAVRARVGLSQSKVYELMASGKFPRPVQLSVRCVGWPQHEIEDWLQERIAERAIPTERKRRRRGTFESAG